MAKQPKRTEQPPPAGNEDMWRPHQGRLTRVIVWIILIAMAIIFLAMIYLVFFT